MVVFELAINECVFDTPELILKLPAEAEAMLLAPRLKVVNAPRLTDPDPVLFISENPPVAKDVVADMPRLPLTVVIWEYAFAVILEPALTVTAPAPFV